MARKTNWSRIRKQNNTQIGRYRNVYENQQLERSQIEAKKTMTTRVIGTVILTIIIFVTVYIGTSFVFFAVDYLNYVNSTTEEYGDADQNEDAALYDQDNSTTKQSNQASDKAYINMDEFISVSPEATQSVNLEGVSEKKVPVLIDYFNPNIRNLGSSFIVSFIFFAAFFQFMQRNLAAQNLMNDTSDINQYQDDQHIALPEEIQLRYDWFPDVGAHSNVQVSSMISHMALSNKGLDKIRVPKRADADIIDENGEIQFYKGEILRDEKGKIIYKTVSMIDDDFSEDLFETSEDLSETSGALPDYRKRYDARKIRYNPDGNDRSKLGGNYETVAELINNDWFFPNYEPQRPAGAYIVDTAPVNTMLLAITRAGKGQTIIEPTIDMWTREARPNNIIINDPKGELLVKFYVRATVRNFQVIQFNLINSMKTDIYNPIGLAAEAAREGDFTKCAQYVESIAKVFFPEEGAEDPVWPKAANNAFKRSAYGLIDFFLEEENELRQYAEKTGMDDVVLNNKLDEMWGKVTLYNCYELFVLLTAKKQKNPAAVLMDKIQKEPEKYEKMMNEEPERYAKMLQDAQDKSVIWENKQSEDLLSLYFNATDRLPQNGMRTLLSNANNALRSMGDAEKMRASVYGIAITAMSFFTDPTISTLTSGRPSQNVDLSGISFPRRFGVRFHPDFIKKYHLVGMQCIWEAFSDRAYKKNMGKEFYHENIISREGWARYYVKGIFPNDTTYIRLRIRNSDTENLLQEFHFSFEKAYQKNLDGRHYIKDPILNEKIVRDGTLTELQPFKKKNSDTIIYKKGKSTFKQRKIRNLSDLSKEDIESKNITKKTVDVNTISMLSARYSEKTKMIFLVTPPHLKQYATLLLILIKQLVDLNFEQSYMTEKNQKPFYKTRFMLDEVGNLESDGHGIQDLSTMLSIGLGQDQQFTLVLQTLQQLRDVYGESEDKIVQGNTSNIIYLKSTDDSMIETLVKMSGVTHESYTDQKTVTRDMEKILMKNEGKTSYTMSTREVPVISANDMQFLPPNNSIVFRAGDAPIWNRNETILPMSWRMFKNTINQPGKEYSLQTVPTLSSAMEFDVRKNQPNFMTMLKKRMEQAVKADKAKEIYKKAYNYSDYDFEQIDPDERSKDIMEIINDWIREEKIQETNTKQEISPDKINYNSNSETTVMEENQLVNETVEEQKRNSEARKKMIYAGGMISKADLISDDGRIVGRALDGEISIVYETIMKYMWRDKLNFEYLGDGNLYSADGNKLYIEKKDLSALHSINNAMKDQDSNVYGVQDIHEEDLNANGKYNITDDFYRFLAGLPNWSNIANGRFEKEMEKRMKS